jgi:hypothetical protein
MKKTLLLALAIVPITLATGCSFIFDPGQSKKSVEPKTGTIASAPLVEKKEAGIEVTWEVPSDPVDGFVIRYGEDRTNLSKEATILRSELREERDSQYGPVYRYILRNIPDSGRVYVAVAAFKGDVISEFSDAIAEVR